MILNNSLRVALLHSGCTLVFECCLISLWIEANQMHSLHFHRISFWRGSNYSKNWNVVYVSIFWCTDVIVLFLIKPIFSIKFSMWSIFHMNMTFPSGVVTNFVNKGWEEKSSNWPHCLAEENWLLWVPLVKFK